MSPALVVALAAVRGWTRLYSIGLDPDTRARREAEIESDLWECHEDARRRGCPPTIVAAHMVVRLAFGAVDDVRWRAEHVRLSMRIVQEALWLAALACIVFVWWLSSTLQRLEPPERVRSGGIDVVRILYPIQPQPPAPPQPRAPRAFARLCCPRDMAPPPPPPPPPPKPIAR